MTTPEELRALDVLVHETVFKSKVVAKAWPCGIDPGTGAYEAEHFLPSIGALNEPDRGPVYVRYEEDWPPKKKEPSFEGDSEWYAPVTPVPFYSTLWADARRVIERMGELDFYMNIICFPNGSADVAFAKHIPISIVDVWYHYQDAKETICYAALGALGGEAGSKRRDANG